MPPEATIREIVSYWVLREDECGMGVDWAEAHQRCWRCAYKSRLHRCHIVPESLGGANDASNLVLLCGRCHREAPNISDPRFMWIWLRSTCVTFYNTYWSARGAEEFEAMFGRPPFTGEVFRGIDVQKGLDLLGARIGQTIVHFGEGRMNPATIASVYALVEQDLTGRFPQPVRNSSVDRKALSLMGLVLREEASGSAYD